MARGPQAEAAQTVQPTKPEVSSRAILANLAVLLLRDPSSFACIIEHNRWALWCQNAQGQYPLILTSSCQGNCWVFVVGIT